MPRPLKGKYIGFLDDLFVDPKYRGQRIGEKILDELTYQKMTEIQKSIAENTLETGKSIPMFIFVG